METKKSCTSNLLERILSEKIDYYDLESFLNKKQAINNCKITIPEMDPNKLPIWKKNSSISVLSTDANYVYELLPMSFANKKYPTIESIIQLIKKQNLFIPLFDLSFYFSNNTGWIGHSPLFIPYMDGKKIKFLERRKEDPMLTSLGEFKTAENWWIDSIIKKQDIMLIFSKKEVVPNKIEISIVKNLKNIFSEVEMFLSPLFKGKLDINVFLKIISEHSKPYDLIQKIINNKLELGNFINSVIDLKTAEIKKSIIHLHSPRGNNSGGIH